MVVGAVFLESISERHAIKEFEFKHYVLALKDNRMHTIKELAVDIKIHPLNLCMPWDARAFTCG